MGQDDDLNLLRQAIRSLDRSLISLASDRVRTAREIGQIKRRMALPTVDYLQEKQVLERVREEALRCGLEPEVAEDISARLIEAAVTAQEADNLRSAATGIDQIAIVVGAAGRMGRWMARFLDAQGFEVFGLDPNGDEDESRQAEQALTTADLIVYSTPPAVTAKLYERWFDGPPKGLIVDIASIKTPLITAIEIVAAAGARIASIHPMFGPSTVLLRGTEVVVCDTGCSEAVGAIEALFLPTTARLVHLPLDEHDRIMADLLALAHATAIAFAIALPESEHPVHSTTFRALETLAAGVVRESPELYYEIQADNPNSSAAVDKLYQAISRLRDAVNERHPEAFRALMREGQKRTPSIGD